jgi:FkbM family methyltransferase
MLKENLLTRIAQVEVYANASKLYRFFKNPFTYLLSILYSKTLYNYTNYSFKINTKAFWGQSFIIKFPSAIDILLSGGKTHNSEIRLAKFLVTNVLEDSNFVDIGAHFGYYTLLVNTIINKGQIISIDASPSTFEILEQNVRNSTNISSFNLALTDKNASIDFYEFPTQFSEYNTLEKEQYKNEDWYQICKVTSAKIVSKTGDDFLSEISMIPNFIKIDVEGAEDKVINGLVKTLKTNNPIVIMEFCSSVRNNTNHINADCILKNLGYVPHCINKLGKIELILSETKDYVDNLNLESDNIVYVKASIQ